MYLVVSDRGGLAKEGLRTPAKDREQDSCPQVVEPCLSLPPHSYSRQNWAPPAPPSALSPIQPVTSLSALSANCP